MITVITPTTGKDSLLNAIASLKNQSSAVPIKHLLLWDNKREDDFLFPLTGGTSSRMPQELECEEGAYSCNCIVINDNFIQGRAAGSALRAVGLMAVNTKYVTFMDDDIMWDSTHLDSIMEAIKDKEWAYSKRRIWVQTDNGYESLGIDEFESVGEAATTPYKMVDNNSMVFKKKYGFSAACLYRNTTEYNDDRLMYNFLKKYACSPGITNQATVNQVCPERLTQFFRNNCTKED